MCGLEPGQTQVDHRLRRQHNPHLGNDSLKLFINKILKYGTSIAPCSVSIAMVKYVMILLKYDHELFFKETINY